jgi:D-alanyl-lipoteichoic acid acyltransferase DltB (MBOAT superfamily)
MMEQILPFLKHVFLFEENSPLLFTQFYFWAFFAVVFACFSLIHSRRLLRNAFLLFVSLFFYYKTSGLFVLILLFVTCSDFLIAKRIHRAPTESRRKAWMVLSVVIDLSLLCYFKYAYFITDVIGNIFHVHIRVFDIFSWVGNILCGKNLFNVDKIVLPVGISFYIFQVISYTVDVYRRKVEPVKNILDFGFYVSFFPQLVAGPIVRASEFVPQLYKNYFLSRRQFGVAVFWILNGLTKKIVLSDYMAVNFIDRVFDNPLLFTGFENLAALFCYSLQVYADFSGYTDIAIGVAMLMGFYLPQNFNSPYKAPNPSNFWKRWHMSLSRWLKSYLYIPLGGNRTVGFGTFFWLGLISCIALILSGSLWVTGIIVAAAIGVLVVLRTSRNRPARRKLLTGNLNSFITMLLGGIWHGASWNFMIWGGLNGLGMIVWKFWKELGWNVRMAVVTGVAVLLYVLTQETPRPLFNVLFVWMAVLFIGTLVRWLWHLVERVVTRHKAGTRRLPAFAGLGNAWAVLQTFTFITFTRLFFRSGSNLDPATANREAWETAKHMVHQMGSAWGNVDVWAVVCAYRNVFLLFLFGMLVHWLPERWKRRLRLTFAALPLPLMALAVVVVVFVVYQFITADLQAFIYFQF